MIMQKRMFRTSRSSSKLTIAIVTSVVLINSVAWGIPLLVRDETGAMPGVASHIQTGSLVQVPPAPVLLPDGASQLAAVLPPAPVMQPAMQSAMQSGAERNVIPLPSRAPAQPAVLQATVAPLKFPDQTEAKAQSELRVIALRPLASRLSLFEMPAPETSSSETSSTEITPPAPINPPLSKTATPAAAAPLPHSVSRPGIRIAVTPGHFDRAGVVGAERRKIEQSSSFLNPVNEQRATPSDFGTTEAMRDRTRPQQKSKQTSEKKDVVFVSPYSPGVRMTTRRQGVSDDRPNLRATPSTSTLGTARVIASRAAERFQEMRDRMVRIAVQGEGSEHDMANRRAVRPVVSIAPQGVPRVIAAAPKRQAYARFSELPSSRMGIGINANNDQSLVRPRLVRRPIPDVTGPSSGDPMPSAPTKYVASRDVSARHIVISRAAAGLRAPRAAEPTRSAPKLPSAAEAAVKQPSLPQKFARAEPATRNVVIEVRRVRRLRARQSSRLRQQKQRAARDRKRRATPSRRVRIATSYSERRIYRSNRRSRGKIDGFRRSFHRQLVKANFFGGQN